MVAMRTLLSLSLLLIGASAAAAQPIVKTIASATDFGCVAVGDYSSMRVAITGTFVAYYKFSAWSDSNCAVGGQVTHMQSEFYGKQRSVSNLNDVYEIFPLAGVGSIRIDIYGATPGHGYTSGTITAIFSLSRANSTARCTQAHCDGTDLSTRPSCSHPSTPCSAPAVSAPGQPVTLILHNEISQNVYLYGIYITVSRASGTFRISIEDGPEGEAISFGSHAITADGAAWERTGAPLYVTRGGKDLHIKVTGSPGAVVQINAVAKR
jgi:hypothetical protein